MRRETHICINNASIFNFFCLHAVKMLCMNKLFVIIRILNGMKKRKAKEL